MANNKLELVSAFVDGELDKQQVDELLPILSKEDALRCQWQRYHVIGEALRNNLPDKMHRNLANRVALSLKEVPTLLSPETINTSPTHSSRKSFTGYAIAASVAVVGFFAVGLMDESLQQNDPRLAKANRDTAIVASSQSSVTQGQFTAFNTADMSRNMLAEPAVRNPEVGSKLRTYVISHEYSATSLSRRGLPPDVRLVTFTTPSK